VIGPNAATAPTGGGGSSHVDVSDPVSPLSALRDRLGRAGVEVKYAIGGSDMMDAAVQAARSAETAIVFAGMADEEGEGRDRTTMALPVGQDELIKAVAAANPNTVVVLTGGNPVSMGQWLDNVKSVLHVWYAGQEGSEAITDLLLGEANPSGKLPVTFLKRWDDSAAYGNYPGINGRVDYQEGVFVGYRHFDAHGIAPQFPFGHGLSYTTFSYSGLKVQALDASANNARVRIDFNLTNTGAMDGAETAQLYVGEKEPLLARPPHELKGFRKVFLKAGETQPVSMELDNSAFAYFDATSMSWNVHPGIFVLAVGSSSRDVRLAETVRLLP
jgi:beta-glucosidase